MDTSSQFEPKERSGQYIFGGDLIPVSFAFQVDQRRI